MQRCSVGGAGANVQGSAEVVQSAEVDRCCSWYRGGAERLCRGCAGAKILRCKGAEWVQRRFRVQHSAEVEQR